MEYDKDLINVIVSDNGIGIEKELFQRICKGETVYDKTTK
jgi:DNA topoisomerase VI subunit B